MFVYDYLSDDIKMMYVNALDRLLFLRTFIFLYSWMYSMYSCCSRLFPSSVRVPLLYTGSLRGSFFQYQYFDVKM